MPDSTIQPSNGKPASSVLGGLSPDELFARGMQSVKMTGNGALMSWEPPTTEEAARLFPNYEILDLIGRGGMGAVYKARQLALDRIVAIKLLPLEISVDRDFAERFKREARTMAKMNHPHIVSVFDFGTTGEGHLFFVMEYVEGTTLHHIIKTTGLKPPQALEIIVGVCEALAYAHVEGVVHRDIKPANVLVDVRGRVKVTDFGLARLNTASTAEQMGYTMTGTVLGTPDYMAPEQKRGAHVDHRADIYSLGVMLYEMLCGQVPQGIFDPPSVRVGVDERVDQVVIRAMQQEPDRRYQNTAEMKHEVQTIRLAHDPNARAPQPRGIGRSPSRRNAAITGGILAASLAVAAAVWFSRHKDNGAAGKAADCDPVPNPPEKVEPSTPGTPTSTNPPAVAGGPNNAATPATPATTPPLATAPPVSTQTPVVINASPQTPSTSLTPTVTPPPTRIEDAPRPPANPELANAVVQISPGTPPKPPEAIVPTVIFEPWRQTADQGDALVKQREFDAAVAAYDKAVEMAEDATPAVSPLEIARIHQKVGNLEALRGSPAEARGSFENAKRALARMKGKPATEATQMLTEIDASLRRLPRE
jgi:serine/threonine protein kinase